MGMGFLWFSFSLRNKKREHPHIHVAAIGMALIALLSSSMKLEHLIFCVPAYASLCELKIRGLEEKRILMGGLISFFLITIPQVAFISSSHVARLQWLYYLPWLGIVVLCATLWNAIRMIDWK